MRRASRSIDERGRLAAIVDSALDAMFVRAHDGTILTWNRAAERIYGYVHDEVIGRDFSLLVPEARRRTETSIFELVLAGDLAAPYESRHRRKDGSLVDVSVTPSPVLNANGDTVGVSSIVRDITEEKALRTERDVLSSIVNSALGAILSTDRDGAIMSWNLGAEHLFGYSMFEVLGKPWTLLSPERSREESKGLLERLLDGDDIVGHETVVVNKEGDEMDVVLTASCIRDPGGHMIGVAAIYHDITARKTAERHLAESEARLREAQSIAQFGSWDLDVSTGTIEWSDEMYRILGFEPGEVEPKLVTFLGMMEEQDSRTATTALANAVDQREPFKFDAQLQCEEGSTAYIEVHGRPYESRDGSVHIAGTALDVTDRKRLEQQLLQSQKMEALGGLAGGIAHDFNNLLAVILNYGRFIEQQLPPDHISRDDIAEMVNAAQRGATLVRQLLSFARREVVRPEPIHLNYLVEQMEPLLRRAITEKVVLELKLVEGLWTTEADRGQIEQLLLNLAVNARDAMPDGGRLEIETRNLVVDDVLASTHPKLTPGNYVALVVSDTGTGMDKATQARIFEPFFTTKKRESGTGLGLASVYGIVERAGGSISVYSEVGLGTTFRIFLPVSELHVDAVPAAGPETGSNEGRGEQIMIVEDELPVLDLITRMLAEAGYKPLPMPTPQEALDALADRDDVDLLLTDMIMPDVSGHALSIATDIPTVFMSGYTDSVIAHQGVLQEGVLFLPKPFSRNELLGVVRRTLDQRSRRPPRWNG